MISEWLARRRARAEGLTLAALLSGPLSRHEIGRIAGLRALRVERAVTRLVEVGDIDSTLGEDGVRRFYLSRYRGRTVAAELLHRDPS